MAYNKNAKESTPKKKTTRKEQHLTAQEAQQRKQVILAALIFVGVIAIIIVIGLVDSFIITPNKVIAAVGEDEITVEEFRTRARFYRWQLLQNYAQVNQLLSYFGDYDGTQEAQLQQMGLLLQSPELLGENVLDSMIQEIIIKNKAEELGIEVSDQEINDSIKGAFGFYPEGTPTSAPYTTAEPRPTLNAEQLMLVTATSTSTPTVIPTPTEISAESDEDAAEEETEVEETPIPTEAMEEEEEAAEDAPTATPAPTATVYTVDIFDENYATYLKTLRLSDISEKEFLQIQEMNLLTDAVFDAITADVPATEEQVWARHILTSDEAGALSVKGQLESGANDAQTFDQLALMLSIDESTASTGGDLGWFGRGTMMPEFEEAAFSLDVGEISEPIQTDYGYHIIQVIAHEDVAVSSTRHEELKQQFFNTWLEEARAEIEDTIVIHEDLRDNYAPSEPSFNNPDIYEAIFGISIKEAQATSRAYSQQQTEQAATLTAMPPLEMITAEPTEAEE